jgi:uncharacterized protein (DUF39 family)
MMKGKRASRIILKNTRAATGFAAVEDGGVAVEVEDERAGGEFVARGRVRGTP